MKFIYTKYGWNAKKSAHFIDVFMGGIFFGSPGMNETLLVMF